MKLEEGMYVRTFGGNIGEIESFKSSLHHDYIETPYCELINKKDIIKASFNIIDLIEEDDYINGLRVNKNKYGELYTSYVYYGGDIGKMCEVYTTWLNDYTEDMINNIVTKEQFESMQYEVE